MGCQDEKPKGVGRPKVKEKRKPRSIKATEAEWKRIVKLLKQIDSPKAVAIMTALENYLSQKGTDQVDKSTKLPKERTKVKV